MIKRITRHFATSMIRMPQRRYETWGKKTLCGKKFYRGDDRLTTSDRWVSCMCCIEALINRNEAKLIYLKWALRDQRSIRSLVMGGDR